MNESQRVAIVSGGGQGIGKGIAQRLLTVGWRVALAELDNEAGEETAAELGAFGDVCFIPTDVADENSVEAMTAAAMQRWGRIDGLVNNAGIAHPGSTPIEKLALSQWRRVLDTNLTGPMLCAKHAARHLRSRQGAIVNIASTRAVQSEADTEPYAASKGGLVALTHALAVSLGPDVRVNSISPGWIDVSGHKKRGLRREVTLRPIDHAQHPTGRVGTPDDIAAMTAFLLSEDAGFITGQNFVIDGGMMVKMIYAD